eukprot:scaffold4792_cov31-Cyclotella_meneghiniana.AAC.1
MSEKPSSIVTEIQLDEAAEREFRRKAWLALAPLYATTPSEAGSPPDDFMPIESTVLAEEPVNAKHAAPVGVESSSDSCSHHTANDDDITDDAKVAEAKPKKQAKTNKPKKASKAKPPPKPYSAYNIFFRLERMYILEQNGQLDQEFTIADASDAFNLNNDDNDPIEHPRPARYARLPLPPRWYSSISRRQAEKSRSHKKKKGDNVLTKTEINALVSQRWRNVDEEIYRYCKRVSVNEKRRREEENSIFYSPRIREYAIAKFCSDHDALGPTKNGDDTTNTVMKKKSLHSDHDVRVASALLMLNQKTNIV